MRIESSLVDSLTFQFLSWVAAEPRSYAQAMDAWRSSCPRLTIWEDALMAELIEVRHDRATKATLVRLTTKGAAALGAVRGEATPESCEPVTADVADATRYSVRSYGS